MRSAQAAAQAQAQQSTITQPPAFEPRMVYPVLRKSGDLGVRLVGGNAVGIFIHSVDPDSAAYHVGKKKKALKIYDKFMPPKSQ